VASFFPVLPCGQQTSAGFETPNQEFVNSRAGIRQIHRVCQWKKNVLVALRQPNWHWHTSRAPRTAVTIRYDLPSKHQSQEYCNALKLEVDHGRRSTKYDYWQY
jgi:hypothetical protein